MSNFDFDISLGGMVEKTKILGMKERGDDDEERRR
jgi:hypothetical protein